MKEQPKVNIDAKDLPTLKCTACGNFTFTVAFVIKRISALISPSGKETIAPVQVFTCASCGAVLPISGDGTKLNFLEDIKNEQKEEPKKSSLIL